MNRWEQLNAEDS